MSWMYILFKKWPLVTLVYVSECLQINLEKNVVLFLLAIVFSVLLRFSDSDCPFWYIQTLLEQLPKFTRQTPGYLLDSRSDQTLLPKLWYHVLVMDDIHVVQKGNILPFSSTV